MALGHDVVTSPYVQFLIQLKARQLCRMSEFNRSDHEDVAQELSLRVLRKAHLYDPARRASTDTFANRVVDSAVKMLLRERRCSKRAGAIGALSIDTGFIVVNHKAVPLFDVVSRADQARVTLNDSDVDDGLDREAINNAVRGLPPELADMAERLKHGNVLSISRDLGVSRRQVYNAIARIREHFKAAGLDKQ